MIPDSADLSIEGCNPDDTPQVLYPCQVIATVDTDEEDA